jgi:hypothetical protein
VIALYTSSHRDWRLSLLSHVCRTGSDMWIIGNDAGFRPTNQQLVQQPFRPLTRPCARHWKFSGCLSFHKLPSPIRVVIIKVATVLALPLYHALAATNDTGVWFYTLYCSQHRKFRTTVHTTTYCEATVAILKVMAVLRLPLYHALAATDEICMILCALLLTALEIFRTTVCILRPAVK